MVPKLHKRGKSFKGACKYVLSDPGKSSTDRVLWSDTLNLNCRPEGAWREMHATWSDRVRLKRAAGVDLRGRDNKEPVLHLTLSWHADDRPSPEHMKETALSSLEALGLEQHQVLMAAHDDKKHPHVHLIVNTVHPENGRTAPLKYSKEKLSRWAEAYERENGIRIEQRIDNNEKRRRLKEQREKSANQLLMPGHQTRGWPKSIPYVPVKHRPMTRQRWFAKKDIINRMKRMRAQMEIPHKIERGALSSQHKKQRNELWRNTKSALDNARSHVSGRFRPHWREMYAAQNRELQHLKGKVTHPLERAVYVFMNSERLGKGRSLSLREMAQLILKPGKLLDRVEQVHKAERSNLGSIQKVEAGYLTDRVMLLHEGRLNRLRGEQSAERQTQWQQHRARTDTISLTDAKERLVKEQVMKATPSNPRQIKQRPRRPEISQLFMQEASKPTPEANVGSEGDASPPKLSRAVQLRKDMQEWRKRNNGRDYGRER